MAVRKTTNEKTTRKKTTRKKATKKRAGRKTIVFDLELIEGFGKIGATMKEISDVLGCSARTIERRMAEKDGHHDPKFRAAYYLGNASRKMSLRRAQTKAALSGNPTMLIWLGKQELDQQDRRAMELSTPTGGITLKFDSQDKGA